MRDYYLSSKPFSFDLKSSNVTINVYSYGGSSLNNRENRLIERCRSGDTDAFEELISPYMQKAYETAYRMCGNHADAEDIAQEAIIKAYRALTKFDGRSAFSTWLYRIISNTVIDMARSRSRRPAASLDIIGDRCDPDPDGNPVEYAETNLLQDEIQSALLKLSSAQRAILIMRDIHDYSYQEIAQMLGISIGTVKSRVHRGRTALQRIIRRNFPDLCSVEYTEGPEG
jgi:RNA polymerase sigma-70 factor (ECF subfamily)